MKNGYKFLPTILVEYNYRVISIKYIRILKKKYDCYFYDFKITDYCFQSIQLKKWKK